MGSVSPPPKSFTRLPGRRLTLLCEQWYERGEPPSTSQGKKTAVITRVIRQTESAEAFVGPELVAEKNKAACRWHCSFCQHKPSPGPRPLRYKTGVQPHNDQLPKKSAVWLALSACTCMQPAKGAKGATPNPSTNQILLRLQDLS